jgi:DHA1 family tetracycline resistance protein-like MFS transporter
MTPSSGPRRAAVAFIFVTVLLDMMALGLIIPVLPHLVIDFMAADVGEAAHVYGLIATVWALMQFAFSPVIGALSDRYGRRPVVLLSNFGLGLDYILMALAPNLAWLFIGRALSGITSASISTAHAYIADVTPAEGRAAKFGLLGVAFGLGFVMGPAIGGMLGAEDPRLPFWVAAGLSLANACYGFFILPESLPPERRAPFEWTRANPFGSLLLLRAHRHLLALAGIMFLQNLAHVALPAAFVLYTAHRYGWDADTTGLTLAAVGICSMVVQGTLVRPAVKRFGERRALMAGLLAGAIGFTIYGLAPTPIHFWMGLPIMALWGLSAPALQGLMTRRVNPSEQGRLQGANSSLMGIGAMIGPTIFTKSFAFFIAATAPFALPGAPFLLAALLLLAGLALALHHAR